MVIVISRWSREPSSCVGGIALAQQCLRTATVTRTATVISSPPEITCTIDLRFDALPDAPLGLKLGS
jgi:hypothetical protein